MLESTKDTVKVPVIKSTVKCTFELCTYDATDHWSGTQEELLFVLEEHVRTHHPIPTAELVEGYVTWMAWDTFRDWWADYRDRYMARRRMSGISPPLSLVRQGAWSCTSWGWSSSWH